MSLIPLKYKHLVTAGALVYLKPWRQLAKEYGVSGGYDDGEPVTRYIYTSVPVPDDCKKYLGRAWPIWKYAGDNFVVETEGYPIFSFDVVDFEKSFTLNQNKCNI